MDKLTSSHQVGKNAVDDTLRLYSWFILCELVCIAIVVFVWSSSPSYRNSDLFTRTWTQKQKLNKYVCTWRVSFLWISYPNANLSRQLDISVLGPIRNIYIIDAKLHTFNMRLLSTFLVVAFSLISSKQIALKNYFFSTPSLNLDLFGCNNHFIQLQYLLKFQTSDTHSFSSLLNDLCLL